MSGRKNIFILSGFVLSVSLIVSSLMIVLVSRYYSRKQFSLLNSVCGEILEQDSEAERMLAAALKEYTDASADRVTEKEMEKDVLTAFGYHPSDFASLSHGWGILFAAAGFVTGLLLFTLTFLYQNKRESLRIQALTDYLEQANAGKAEVIGTSGEDDFSRLEDEIYKTVTFLYQTRDAAIQAKDDFAENLSNIAHQIKTPITAISLSVQTMEEEHEKVKEEKHTQDRKRPQIQEQSRKQNPKQNQKQDLKQNQKHLEQIQKQLLRLTHLEEALLVLASFSLIVVIHNSFAVSMNARIHQFGIFSSIGATPKQIRACLLQEAFTLCAIPIIAGNLLGILASMGLLHLVNVMSRDVAGRHEAVFGYHPLVLILTLLVTILTIWISAWLPAGKLSRMTPLEAIKNTGELQLKRRKSFHILRLIFGMKGELAGNALKAQRKALRTASLSLVLSFMAFTIMQCFFTMSDISTRETYFERYLDVWDIMVTVKDAEIDAFEKTAQIQELTGIKSAVVYQKATAECVIREEDMSEAMKSFGGFAHASGNYVTKTDEGWLVNAPIVILDDSSFLVYCEQIGAAPQLDGTVIRNQIRDVTNPDFRHPEFMPYIKEENGTSVLRQTGREDVTAEIPVICYTEEVPVLREEYATLDYYELVHFIPTSLWKDIKGQIGGVEEDVYIRVLCGENASLEKLNDLQAEIHQLLNPSWAAESENRIQKQKTNEE